VHFTRDPIIETVITAREGYKLSLKKSKAKDEEFFVDAIEVVSFGNALFYRCLEKPKAFLLPVTDYEIVETKEQRVALRAPTSEKGQKGPQSSKEEGTGKGKGSTKKKQKKKRAEKQSSKEETKNQTPSDEKKSTEEGGQVFSRLFPPPPTLIKEKLSLNKEEEIVEANLIADGEKHENQSKPEEKSSAFPEPEPLDQPIFNPDFFEDKEEEKEVTKND
jgi:hypothetical protein